MTSETRANPAPRRTSPEAGELLRAGLLLAGVCLVAHFLYVRRFGLYEDDYIYTLGCFDWSLGHWWQEAVKAIVHPVQGRPLNHLVRRTINFILLRDGTLLYGHLFSWAMLSVNATLLYALARRHLARFAALAAALVYVLYPADTSRQILMHQSDLLFGATLCLLALLAFARGREWLGWALGVCCLLNYESFYLPLVVAPLLAARIGARRDWRQLVRHVATFGAVAGLVLAARGLLGDDRARDVAGGAGGMAWRALASLWLGPWASLKAGVSQPLAALGGATLAELGWSAAVAAGAMAALVGACGRDARDGDLDAAAASERAGPGQVALAGLLAWSAAYALSVRPDNFPPTTVLGRLSGVHVAGSLGAALFAGALLEALRRRTPGRRSAAVLAASAALAFGAMAARGLRIQTSEYAENWRQQRAFWSRLVSLVPDLRDGEPVIVDLRGPKGVFPETPGFPMFGLVNYAPVTLHRLIDYPKTWKTVPRVYCLYDGCPAEKAAGGVLLRTPSWFWDGLWPVLRNGEFVALGARGGSLVRTTAPLALAGENLCPRLPEAAAHGVKLNALGRALLGPK